jgi:hypothetical protein
MNRDPLGERVEEMRENIEAFLTDLAVLSRKHGIALGGCGCCDSPVLYPLIDNHAVYEAMPNKLMIIAGDDDEWLSVTRKDGNPDEAIAVLLNCLENGKQQQKGFLKGK